MFIFSFIFEERRCTRRFLRLVCIFETPKTGLEGLGGTAFFSIFFTPVAIWRPEAYRHEMQHVKDGVVASLLISIGFSVFPFAVLVLRGVSNVYPPDAFPLVIALFPWAILWFLLVWLLFEFRAYRYADGLSFRETLQKLTLYAVEKKFGNTVFENAVATLAAYWMLNVVIALFKSPPASFYHFIVVLVASMATLVVLAVVVGWVLDVFTRRLFGEALGKFLFATFVAGAVFHPLLGVFTSFLFSWAMFGRASDAAAAAAAVSALSLFAVMLPGWVWTSVFLL
jgi:MFS family permease